MATIKTSYGFKITVEPAFAFGRFTMLIDGAETPLVVPLSYADAAGLHAALLQVMAESYEREQAQLNKLAQEPA